MTLYYPLEGMLVAGTAPVKRQPDTQAQARETLVAVLQDRRAAQAPVLRDIKLRAFYLDAQGTAYIDLTPGELSVRASAWDEQLAVYALVNTLMQNFEEIKQVAFLVDGTGRPDPRGAHGPVPEVREENGPGKAVEPVTGCERRVAGLIGFNPDTC